MNSFAKLAAVCAAAIGLFLQTGDKTVPAPVNPFAEITGTTDQLNQLETHLKQRQADLDEVLASLEKMQESRDVDSTRLAELAELVSEWSTDKDAKFVKFEEATTTLEERVTALEEQVKALQKQCSAAISTSTATPVKNANTGCPCGDGCQCNAGGTPCPCPKVSVAAPVYQGPVYATSYGSTGTSVSYGSTGTSVSYGSTGTSVSYGSTGGGGPTTGYSRVTHTTGSTNPRTTVFASSQRYMPQWTYPGTITSHMASGHGQNVAGKSTDQLLREHDALHNGGSVSTSTTTVSDSNCPGGVCPTGGGGRQLSQPVRGPLRMLFGRR